MRHQVLAPPPLLPETRQDMMQPELVDDIIAVSDMLLLPPVPADYAELPRTGPEATVVRILHDVADDQTELLNEELLALLVRAAG